MTDEQLTHNDIIQKLMAGVVTWYKDHDPKLNISTDKESHIKTPQL